MFGNTRETTNVCEQDRDGLTHAAQFERLRIVEHLLHDVLRQEPAVVRAGHFLARKAFVSTRILNGDGGLRGYRTDQLEIVRLEGRKRIETVGIKRAMNA